MRFADVNPLSVITGIAEGIVNPAAAAAPPPPIVLPPQPIDWMPYLLGGAIILGVALYVRQGSM